MLLYINLYFLENNNLSLLWWKKTKRYVKESIEAKENMANLRSKRRSNKKTIKIPSNSPKSVKEIKKCKNMNVIFHKFLIYIVYKYI